MDALGEDAISPGSLRAAIFLFFRKPNQSRQREIIEPIILW
jgi:hypothetical protein